MKKSSKFNFNKRIWVVISIIILFGMLYIIAEGEYTAFLFITSVLVPIVAKLLVVLTGKKIAVSIEETEQVVKEQRAAVKITVKNSGLIPVFGCCINVSLNNVISGESDQEKWNFAIGIKKSRDVIFDIKDSYCGYVKIRVDNMLLSDPMGLFKKTIETSTERGLYVMPDIGHLPISREHLNKYDMESYKYSSEKKGSDPNETFGIRQYSPGDSMKTIHWKLSGKMDEIMIRELGLPVENKLLVLIDKNLTGDADAERRDRATKLFLSISNTVAKGRIPHSVGWYNYEKNKFEIRKIDGEDQLWDTVPLLLQSPYKEDNKSTIEHYLESDSEKNFANFIYVTDDERDTERLMNYGEVNIYNSESFG